MLFNITSREPEGKVIRIGRVSICFGEIFVHTKNTPSTKKVKGSKEMLTADQHEEPHLTALDLLRAFDNKTDSYNSTKLRNKLKSIPDLDLDFLITEILSETISYQRHLTDTVMNSNKEKDHAFFKAAIWHLSDVLHNMPSSLRLTEDKQSKASIAEEKIMYVEHYFCFLKAFQKLGEIHFSPPDHLVYILHMRYSTDYLSLIEDYC